MDHDRTWGTLLNMKLSPDLIEETRALRSSRTLSALSSEWVAINVQFNLIRADRLRDAQPALTGHSTLIVRAAGYSDYFCDPPISLHDESIARTEYESL